MKTDLLEFASKEIIINKMYIGSYLSEGDNIGHEIINLYKADDGKNYIYLNSQGSIDLCHREKKLTILLVRKFSPRTYKVLAKAEGITILPFADRNLTRNERYKGQVELGLSYGGVRLVDLFNKNLYHGSIKEEKNVFTTFVANAVIKPKNQLLITDDESCFSKDILYIRTKKGFGKQTLREFFDKKEKPQSFADLERIINNDNLWEDANTTQTISELSDVEKNPYYNFLNIIKQEDNELVFSNMFYYFFKNNKSMFCRFAKTILDIEIDNNFIIEREKNNIDLLISDKNNVAIIENKIKSNINGIDNRHNIYSGLVQSQLEKYYQYIKTDDEYKNKKSYFYIFSPNYNHIDLSKFMSGDKYTIIYYKDIYEFFLNDYDLLDDSSYYLKEFINAMYKHSKDYENDLEEEMQRRFQKAIKGKKIDNLL
ncbi:MAG: PD-(D/E)XK nuclease family protein [Coprobacillus sp.]